MPKAVEQDFAYSKWASPHGLGGPIGFVQDIVLWWCRLFQIDAKPNQTLFFVGANGAAMAFDDGLGDGQSDPKAAGKSSDSIGAVESIK